MQCDELINRFEAIAKTVPWIHKQLWHPKDLILSFNFKLRIKGGFWFGFCFWPLFLLILGVTPISSIAMMVSCFQTFKVRSGKKIVKTDGKLLAWMVTRSFNMRITRCLCDLLALKRLRSKKDLPEGFIQNPFNDDEKYWRWGRSSNMACHYFLDNKDYPTVKIMERVEAMKNLKARGKA